MSDCKAPARWRTVPKLKNSNPDLYRIARGWRMRRIVGALLLLLCDLGIYRLYFFRHRPLHPRKARPVLARCVPGARFAVPAAACALRA